jgi:hypothetical protein
MDSQCSRPVHQPELLDGPVVFTDYLHVATNR